MGWWLLYKINNTEFTENQVATIVIITIVMFLLVIYIWNKEN